MARILVVDDEHFVRELIRRYLTRANHVILEAQDGYEALDLLSQESVDLVITDQQMPRITGAELIRRVRKEFPQVKTVAMSGFGIETAEAAGVDGAITKPFTRQQLLDVIHGVLPQHFDDTAPQI